MFAVFALFVRIFSNPFSNVLQKKLVLCGKNPLWVSFISFLILSVFCIIPAMFFNRIQFDGVFLLYVLIGGVLGALGNWFLIEALKCGELSVLGPINSYKSVVGMVFAFVILKEIPALWQFLGIILLILGSYFIFDSQNEKFTLKLLLRRDIRYRIFALIFTALEAVFIKKIIILSDTNTAFILWCFSNCVFSFLLLLFQKKNFKDMAAFDKKSILMFFALAMCIFLMQYSTNIVFKYMNVSSALALFQLSALISVIFGRKYFGEKNLIKKLTGTLIMIIGSVVIILF